MMMILEVQEGSDVANMPQELLKMIASVRGEFAEGIMIGTKPVDGKQLVFINADSTKEEVEWLTNNDLFDDETGEQIGFDLGWSVLAVENEVIDQSLLLPYFLPRIEIPIDENGVEIEPVEVAITDLTNKLQVWSGKQWLYS